MTRINKYRGIETDTGNVINMDEVSDYIRTRWCEYITIADRVIIYTFFSSPDPKGHVSYCHHLASVVSVVRRKLFQKSSPLKVLDQWKPNLVWIITRVSSFKIVSDDAVHQPTWPLLLKIEHMVKLQVFGNNSKTVNNIKNLTWVKMISTSRSTYPAILK